MALWDTDSAAAGEQPAPSHPHTVCLHYRIKHASTEQHLQVTTAPSQQIKCLGNKLQCKDFI